MRILLATTNPGKLREIRAVLNPSTIDLIGLNDLDQTIDEPVEDGGTFEENAIKKARHYAQAAGLPTLAEDSGLEVDALGGEPGVHSARYAGDEGSRETRDQANNQKLLRALEGVPADRRGARFVCAMVLVAPPGVHFADVAEEEIITVRGEMEGRILLPNEAADAEHPERGRGEHGFGYDPLFFVPDLGRTTAELDPAEKNAISHRGQATRAMVQRLLDLIESPQG